MEIRPANEEDLDDIARIFDLASGWLTEKYRPDQVDRPFPGGASRDALYRHLLETGGMFIALDPEPVGFSAAIVRDRVWFLSLLWVVPDSHGSGIGSALLDESLTWGRDSDAFSVVASPYPVAQTIYLRSSMYPMWLQMDLAAESPEPAAADGAEDLTDSDQPWVDELDREVRGVARPEDHGFWRKVARGVVLKREGGPLGYVYSWPDGKIGPGAVRDPADLPRLLAAGRAIAGNGKATIAVPSVNWTALRELIRLGFKPIGSNMFMSSRPLGDATRYISSGGALS